MYRRAPDSPRPPSRASEIDPGRWRNRSARTPRRAAGRRVAEAEHADANWLVSVVDLLREAEQDNADMVRLRWGRPTACQAKSRMSARGSGWVGPGDAGRRQRTEARRTVASRSDHETSSRRTSLASGVSHCSCGGRQRDEEPAAIGVIALARDESARRSRSSTSSTTSVHDHRASQPAGRSSWACPASTTSQRQQQHERLRLQSAWHCGFDRAAESGPWKAASAE